MTEKAPENENRTHPADAELTREDLEALRLAGGWKEPRQTIGSRRAAARLALMKEEAKLREQWPEGGEK